MATTSSILSPTLRRFLSSPRLARLCTVGADGYPHVIPIYFARVGDEIIFGTDPDETKVRNALRNPKSAVVIGGDPDSDPAGYLIQGDLAVEPHPSRTSVRRLLRRYEAAKDVEDLVTEWMKGSAVILRLRPRKVVRVW